MTNDAALRRPDVLSAAGQEALRNLMRAWFEFERRLAKVPLLRRLDTGSFSLDDYRRLLLHLRPQVVEGARWIARAASSFDRDHADIRSVVIRHAWDEHRDYEILERDYVASGGDLATIRAQPMNVGSECLHSFLMYRASLPNPRDLLGAMWIIEGLGNKMALEWADRIEAQVGTERVATQFLRYHAANDDSHLDKLYGLLDRLCTDARNAEEIVRTARIVGRLYALQLEEIEHE